MSTKSGSYNGHSTHEMSKPSSSIIASERENHEVTLNKLHTMSSLILKKANTTSLEKIRTQVADLLISASLLESQIPIVRKNHRQVPLEPMKTYLRRKSSTFSRDETFPKVALIKSTSNSRPEIVIEEFVPKKSLYGQYNLQKSASYLSPVTNILILGKYRIFYRNKEDEDLTLGIKKVDEQVTLASKELNSVKCDSNKTSCSDVSR